MRPIIVAFLLTGCLGDSSKPEVVDPPDDPVPTPVPTPVPPAPTMPDGSTLLVDIPTADWGWICDRVSLSQDAVQLTCPDFAIDWPARTREEDAAACVERFEPASTWTGCQATFSDFLVATNFIPDSCAPVPPEVDAVRECINPSPPTPPPPPPPPPVCETLFSTVPFAGQSQVVTDIEISWAFSGVDTTLTAELLDETGVPVTGTGSWVLDSFVFVPDAPLLEDTTYTAAITWCSGAEASTFDFSTTSVGPVVPPATLPGHTYAVDLASPSLTFVQPPGVGGLLQSQLGGIAILVEVEDATATELVLRAGVGSTGPFAQDLCQPTAALPSSDFSTNPYFTAGPATLPVDMGLVAFDFEDLTLEGAITGSADAMLMDLEAVIDTRPLVDLVSPGGGDSAVCDLMLLFGVSCIPCAGGGDFCLPIEVTDIIADEQPNLTLVERTAADILADPLCP